MTVVDASVVLEILSQSEAGRQFEEQLRGEYWHAPHIIDIEVLHTLRRWVLSGALPEAGARRAIDAFLAFPVIRHAHVELLPRIWALRNNLTAYDASYLALAQLLDAQLVTRDAGLQKAASRRFH